MPVNQYRPQTLINGGVPDELKWPWTDRGRSALTEEDVRRELHELAALLGSLPYRQHVSSLVAGVPLEH